MAREEVDREDLLRDATALVRRIELDVPGEADPVVAGFRRTGAASFYFGADPAYHFNSGGRLRRAYLSDHLLKAERGRLVSLRRERTDQAVELRRTELNDERAREILAEMKARLEKLQRAIANGAARVVGHVPAEGNVLAEVAAWLAVNPSDQIAQSPNAC